jgi:hypothetical protein
MIFEVIDAYRLSVILTDGSYRQFQASIPLRFSDRNFRKLDPKTILLDKINNGDYTHTISNIALVLNFTIHNNNNDLQFTLYLDEVFTEIDIADIPNELQKQFMILQNQIRYLNAKLEIAEETVFNFKHKDYGSDNGGGCC